MRTINMLLVAVFCTVHAFGATTAKTWSWRSVNTKATALASGETYAAQVGQVVDAMVGNLKNGNNPIPVNLRVGEIMRPADNTYPSETTGHATRFALSVWSDTPQKLLAFTSYRLESTDSNNTFAANNTFAQKKFLPNRVGIHYGADGVKGTADDKRFERGEAGTELVHELHYVGIANPFRSDLESVRNYMSANQGAQYTAEYSLVDDQGDEIVKKSMQRHYFSGIISPTFADTVKEVLPGVSSLQTIRLATLVEAASSPASIIVNVTVRSFDSSVIGTDALSDFVFVFGSETVNGVVRGGNGSETKTITFELPGSITIPVNDSVVGILRARVSESLQTGDIITMSTDVRFTGSVSGFSLDAKNIGPVQLTVRAAPRFVLGQDSILVLGLGTDYTIQESSGFLFNNVLDSNGETVGLVSESSSWSNSQYTRGENGDVVIEINPDRPQAYYRVVPRE